MWNRVQVPLFLKANFVQSISTEKSAVNETDKAVVVSKCCEVHEILVETRLGVRECKKRTDLLHIDLKFRTSTWEPAFFEDGREIHGPRSIVLNEGMPKCDFDAGEVLHPVVHNQRIDHGHDLKLLLNGKVN